MTQIGERTAMEREQMEEFVAVRQTVCDGLRLAKYIDGAGSIPVCQYLVMPAFENPVSWDVVRVVSRTADERLRLYRSCWRMDVDGQAMRSPVERLKHPRPYVPTVEVDWVPIEPTRVEPLLARLRTIRLPLAVAKAHWGLDGVRFELSAGDLFCSARTCWWGQLPGEWLELGPVVTDLTELFEQTWARRAERDPGS